MRRETQAEPTVEPIHPPDPLITVKGLLNRLDCLGRVARLHVVAGSGTFVLLIRQPERVMIGGGGTRELRCGPQKTAVSVRFASGKADKYGTDGDVHAIDFLNAP